MSRRASMFGTGGVGGTVEYRGDITPPVTSYASALPRTPLAARLGIPGSLPATDSAVVNRVPRSGGMRFFYSHGAVPMPTPLPNSGVAYGGVNVSQFQPNNVQLMDWQINPNWFEAGYPRNLGYSTRVPQPQTNVTGGPGKSSSDQRPLFTRVQVIPRAQATVRTYPTRSTGR